MDELLYLYMFIDNETENCKVGIALNPKSRSEIISQLIDYDKSYCVIGEDKLIRTAEKGVHKTFFTHNIKHEEQFDGHTEWFNNDIVDDIKEYLKKYFGLENWVLVNNNKRMEYEEKLYRKKIKAPIITEFTYRIIFKNNRENIELYQPYKTEIKNIFEWPDFKKLWIWYYCKTSSKYNITYTNRDKNVHHFITIMRDDILQIEGEAKILNKD